MHKLFEHGGSIFRDCQAHLGAFRKEVRLRSLLEHGRRSTLQVYFCACSVSSKTFAFEQEGSFDGKRSKSVSF